MAYIGFVLNKVLEAIFIAQFEQYHGSESFLGFSYFSELILSHPMSEVNRNWLQLCLSTIHMENSL